MADVVAFDALGTVFDLGALEERMPRVLQRAAALTLSGRWAPFEDVTRAVHPQLPQQLGELAAYDDARDALSLLQDAGKRVWMLTNGGGDATLALLDRNGLAAHVDAVHSVEEVRRYKPHPDVYRLLPAGATLVAAHDWDVAGATSAGYGAVWIERGGWSLPLPPPAMSAQTLIDASRLLAQV